MDIQVEQGIGYIKEFNGTLHIGTKNKFEPMMDWIGKKVKINIKSAGKRYAPNLLNSNFLNQELQIKNIFSDIKEIDIVNHIQDEIFKINNFHYKVNSVKNISLTIEEVVNRALTLINEIDNELSILSRKIRRSYSQKDFADYADDSKIVRIETQNIEANVKKSEYLSSNLEILQNLVNKLQGNSISFFLKQVLFISGEALIGKTHLFCDVALSRIAQLKPTLLFFGNQFDISKTIMENMISNLGIEQIDQDIFLEALDKWGKEYDTRTLIMIDALNETENPKIWQDGIIKLCEQIKKYPNLTLAMSIRDVEKNKIITPSNEEYITNEIVEVRHKGFEGIELEAVQTFCDALGVEFPKVPLHAYRLFVNPGMLFIYIESIKNSTKKIDTSIIDPLTIFENYLADLERKYYQRYSDEIDEDDETVREAIKEFIALGTKKDLIHFYLDYKEIKQRLKLLHNKVLEFLISEGVLNKLKEENSTKVYFTYQKFENFFIADFLLSEYEKNKAVIFQLIKEYNGAITEALFMQIPEKLSKEIFDLNVWLIRDEYICEQYLKSLVWRKPSTINENTFKYINFILGYEYLDTVFLDTTLQLSSITKHPLNMSRLHKKLLKFTMPERDYNWSIYLHNSYSEDRIVKRIINWVWDKKEEFEIEDESLYLYGLTLGWFLTSSNRELRDAATKALVNLFTDRGEVFLRVLKEFETVDDLYVLERLYSAGYGIILRSSDENGFRELGEYIYETIFNQGEVIDHMLLRDYAKSIVKVVDKLLSLQIDISKIEPPYNQHIGWELPEIEKREVEQYYDDYLSIYSSALTRDFKIYIVYPYANRFLNLKLKERPHSKMPKIRYDEFFDSLNSIQKEEYEKTRLLPREVLSALNDTSSEEIENDFNDEDITTDILDKLKELKRDQSYFKELLSPEQLEEYESFIVNYKQSGSRELGINVKYVKRLVFLEAIKLGWEKELFEEFDRSISGFGRREHTTERIGKKYQWIALYKVLARLTDNYEFREESYGEKIIDYQGLYQLPFTHDIDPTTILQSKHQVENKWWFNVDTSFENLKISNKEWMANVDKLPTISQCVNHIKDETKYLLLHSSFSMDGTKEGKSYRNLYYHIDAFVIKKYCLHEYIAWLNTVDYFGQDKLPQANSLHDVYLREYPDSDSFKHVDAYYHGQVDWDDSFNHEDSVMPCEILLTSTLYVNEGRSYDKSVDETIGISLPSKWFVNEMSLQQTLNDGEWINPNGEVTFFDPTVYTGSISQYNENGVLLADKKLLMEFLESKGYTLLWVVWGEKQVRGTDDSIDDKEFLGFGEISGYGYFDDGEFIEDIEIKYDG